MLLDIFVEDNSYLDIGIIDRVEKAREIIWELESNGKISNDFETIRTLRTIVDDLENYKNFDLRDLRHQEQKTILFEVLTELSDKEFKELISEVKEYNDEENEEITLDDAMNKMQEWQESTVDTLKQECRDNDLKVSGTKKEIIGRLKEYYLFKYGI